MRRRWSPRPEPHLLAFPACQVNEQLNHISTPSPAPLPPPSSLAASLISVVFLFLCLPSIHLFPERWQSEAEVRGRFRVFAIHPRWERDRSWDWRGGETLETQPGQQGLKSQSITFSQKLLFRFGAVGLSSGSSRSWSWTPKYAVLISK